MALRLTRLQRPAQVPGETKTLLLAVAFLFLCIAGAQGQSSGAQEPTDLERARKSALAMSRSREIPEATLPCTPEETAWWQELRKAAKTIQESRSGWKIRDKFLNLLHQGQEKGYRPPIADSRPVVLVKTPPQYTEQARLQRIKGSVSFVVELRPDGYVGEVEIVRGLGSGLEENVIDAAHRTVFLPMVKDRKFVAYHVAMVMNFDVY
jgi:TonB family protein